MSNFMSTPGSGWAKSVFQVGRGRTLAIPLEIHQAARKKLVELFRKKGITNGVILLQGGEEQCQYDSDTEVLFRQDSWFNYLFGVKEAGVYGTISIETGLSTLFIPKLPSEYRIWCGEIHPPSHFKDSYAVDEALYVEDLVEWVKTTLGDDENTKLHVMTGVNSDSGLTAKPARFEGDDIFWSTTNRIDTTTLYQLLSLSRVIKSPEEIEVMRYCAYVASNAHVAVMKAAKSCSFEYELEAKFLFEIYANGGCRRCAYTSICACGPNSSVLHYGHAGAPNDRMLTRTDMALLDMGAEYHGYVSDITCSFPMSGKFTADQVVVYESVLAAQKAVFALAKPGVSWVECHRAAERAILSGLLAIGVLHNGTVDELQAQDIGAVFFPHGLGHLIGCDTHDVGGYIEGTPMRASHPGVNKLRTARILEEGMVLTNEPGCYFIEPLLTAALTNPNQSKYFNTEILARFRGTGGVRLEDVVVITEGGIESLSTCPRTVQEIEQVMSSQSQGVWPPVLDHAPGLKRHWTRLAEHGKGMEDHPNVQVVVVV